MGILSGLEPAGVFMHFEELTKIPRGSGDEKRVSDYLKKFADDRGLDVVQDEFLNIIIRKEGTPGYENSPAVILQGHMDMVNEKNNETVHDFAKDPLKLVVREDFIYADGTTLGADNGVAVAYALAVLESTDIPHPPLEVLFTVEEETGLVGASSIDGGHFKGKVLINIDNEEEGVFLVSCAGGARQVVRMPLKKQKAQGTAYMITVKGLRGGHSGMDISKERGNSNKILGRVLYHLDKKFDFQLANLKGGAKSNAIPREAEAVVLFRGNCEGLQAEIELLNGVILNEIRTQDPGLLITGTEAETPTEMYDFETTKKAIRLLMLLPNGIMSFSQDIMDLVETSLNLGVVSEDGNTLNFEFAVRSSVDTRKKYLMETVRFLAESLGAYAEVSSAYPAWQYNRESKIRDRFIEVYKGRYGKDPEVKAIHAGVECGLLSEKIEGLDMISFGPDMYDVHTPEEHVSISSMTRTYEFLIDVLASLK